MEPTICKPEIYKGAGIYKIGAEGDGDVVVDINKYQGTRGTPISSNIWPNELVVLQNRVCTQPLYLNNFIGKKLSVSTSEDFLLGVQDGTEYNMPFNSYSWARSIELVIEYGIITIAAKRIDDTDLSPNDINISVVLTNE